MNPPTAEQLASLADFSVDALVLIDVEGVIEWANPATEHVLGHRPQNLVGLRVGDLIEPEDRGACQDLVRGLLDCPGTPGRGRFR